MSLSSVAPLRRGCATRSLETDDLHKARYVCLCMYVYFMRVNLRTMAVRVLRNKSKSRNNDTSKIAHLFHISRVALLYNFKFIIISNTYTVSLISKELEYPVIKIYYYLCVASFDSIKNVSIFK